MPGEIASSHRHSQSALRFVVQGSSAYTAVAGERSTMRPGDFVITPSWTFHDHGNPSGAPQGQLGRCRQRRIGLARRVLALPFGQRPVVGEAGGAGRDAKDLFSGTDGK